MTPDRTFPPPGHYNRPTLGIWRWAFVPPEVRAATLYGVAWGATTILFGLRVWRAFAEHDDEIGD